VCSFVSLASLLQKLPLNKAPGPDCTFAQHLLYADESLRFFLSELFNMCIRGGARHFHLGGPLEGTVLQQGSCQWSV